MTRGRTGVHPQSVVRTWAVCLLVALACSSATALETDRTIAQFAHTTWGTKDGAPSVVKVLAQSADGYVWMGASTDCIDSTVSFSNATSLSRAGHSRPRKSVHFWPFPTGIFGSVLDPERSAF